MSDVQRCNECRHCDYVQIMGQYGVYKACTQPNIIQAGGKPIGAKIDGRQCQFYSRGTPQKSGRLVA